jgi:hypothetical protein
MKPVRFRLLDPGSDQQRPRLALHNPLNSPFLVKAAMQTEQAAALIQAKAQQ